MRHLKRDLAAIIALASAAMPWAVTASDQKAAYPQRPVTLVIGFPPGGSADALAQLIARSMGETLGKKVIVQYKPGAGGNIGAEYVARAASDGYTVFLGGRPNTIHKTMYRTMKYDFARDLVPVGLVARVPFVMVSSAYTPIATIRDIVRLARTYPGALTCASPGAGTTAHLLCELLQQEMDLDMRHVPYSGGAQAITDVIGGRVDLYVSPVAGALPHIRAGKLRPIVVMSPERLPTLPDVPTLAEAGLSELSGLSELELGDWSGLVAPIGTPTYVVEILNRSINAALINPALHDPMARQAFATPQPPNTPMAFQELIAEETERWNGVLRMRNIKPLH
ncbi:Bug family tripartite tricarboxylate transporter substrate binding protein [Bordetella bronchialis]|uniref:Bug family tripartite tricarboxylate transporter substrate binding protein n=1 Tax=Bordetella bronchialis TaxID=463025 RepID=UPI003D00EAAC